MRDDPEGAPVRDAPSALFFRKMHGLGNDFVVIDRRGAAAGGPVPAALARAMGDRRRGVGFDQMAVIEDDGQAHARLVFLNADGSEAGACGNATRCVARLLMDEAGTRAVTLRTARGLLACEDAGNGRNAGSGSSAGIDRGAGSGPNAGIGPSAGGDRSLGDGRSAGTRRGAGGGVEAGGGPAVASTAADAPTAGGDVRVNMGAPLTDWRDVPLAEAADTLHLPLPGAPVACSMGNPHCTFVVEDAEAADIEALGRFETHPLFPERTNVQAVSVRGDRLRVRVWERGVGVTPASGSSACAAAVACARRGLAGRSVTVDLDGGALAIDWREDGVWMTGPTAHVFDGFWRLP